jgi:hypothetical protein
VIATEPRYLNQIAKEVGIPMTNPAAVQVLSQYVEHLKEHTQEAEMVWVEARAGKKFIGFKLTEHGRKMLEIS